MITQTTHLGRMALVLLLISLAPHVFGGASGGPGQKGQFDQASGPSPVKAINAPGPEATQGPLKHPLPEMLKAEPAIPQKRQGASASNSVPGEIIVKFKKGSKAAQTLQSATAGAKSVSEDLSRSTELAPLVAKHGVSAIEPVFGRAKSASKTKALPEAAAQRDDLFRWTRLRLPKNANVAQALADLKAQPSVETAEPNYEWGLARIFHSPI